MNYNDKSYSLDSNTFFKSIVKIDFVPMAEITSSYHKPRYKKGDVLYKRRLFRKKKVKKVFDEDMWVYSDCWGERSELMNIYEYAKKCDFIALDGKLYFRPAVRIETTHKDNNRYIKFDTNQEANDYIASLKEKCKLCENSLL